VRSTRGEGSKSFGESKVLFLVHLREQTSSPSCRFQEIQTTREQRCVHEASLERVLKKRRESAGAFLCLKKGKHARRFDVGGHRSFFSSPRRHCCCLHSPLNALSLPATPRRGSAGRGGRPELGLRERLPTPLRESKARKERRSFFLLCLRPSEGVSGAKKGDSTGKKVFFFFLSWVNATPSLPLVSLFSSHFLPLPSPLSCNTMRAAALAPSPRSAAAFASAAPRRASAVAPLAAKPTKAADFRGLSNDEIDTAVAESKRALFDMRIAQKTRQVRRRWFRASLGGSHVAKEGAPGAIRKAASRAVVAVFVVVEQHRRLVATTILPPDSSCFAQGFCSVRHCAGAGLVNAGASSRRKSVSKRRIGRNSETTTTSAFCFLLQPPLDLLPLFFFFLPPLACSPLFLCPLSLSLSPSPSLEPPHPENNSETNRTSRARTLAGTRPRSRRC